MKSPETTDRDAAAQSHTRRRERRPRQVYARALAIVTAVRRAPAALTPRP